MGGDKGSKVGPLGIQSVPIGEVEDHALPFCSPPYEDAWEGSMTFTLRFFPDIVYKGELVLVQSPEL